MAKQHIKKSTNTSVAVKDKGAYIQIYEDALPDLMTQNVLLQKKALDIIEEKIEGCTATQAATIYGILWDKCNMLMARKNANTTNNQMNMFICSGNDEDSADLMEKVLTRMKGNKDDGDKMVQANVEIRED